MKRLALLVALVGSLAACSEHDCSLDNEESKKLFGDIAAMTKGAEHCYVSAGSINDALEADGASTQQLIATHYKTTVDDVAKRYESFLKEKGWEVVVEKHEGKRGNGEAYEGKRILAKKDGRQLGTIVYELGDKIIDTATLEIPTKKSDDKK